MPSGRATFFATAGTLALLSLAARGVPDDIAAGLSWRLIGPFRAGWATAVTGVAGQPDTYYFGAAGGGVWKTRSEEHTSELQSRLHLVCRLLLEKKKKHT